MQSHNRCPKGSKARLNRQCVELTVVPKIPPESPAPGIGQ